MRGKGESASSGSEGEGSGGKGSEADSSEGDGRAGEGRGVNRSNRKMETHLHNYINLHLLLIQYLVDELDDVPRFEGVEDVSADR